MLPRIHRLLLDRPILLISALIFFFIAYAYFSGKIADFFLGEEYYVLGSAAVYPHWEAWWRYFLSNGRLFEGIYWTYLYETVDFNPAIIRLFSYGLLFMTALLMAVAISKVWPTVENRGKTLAFVLGLAFFNLYALNWVTRLSGDNARLAIIFFWCAVIMLQLWASNEFRKFFLYGAISFQVVSIFTYENTIFLFPVAILLSIPLIPKAELERKNYRRMKQLIGFGLVSLFFVLIPYSVYYIMARIPGLYLNHYAVSLSSLPLFERILSVFATLGQNIIHLASTDVTDRGLAGLLCFIAVFATAGMIIFFRYFRKTSNKDHHNDNFANEKMGYSILFLSAIWILIFGMIPYSFVGLATYRVYVTAMMGFPIVILLLCQLSRGKWRLLAAGVVVIWVLLAFIEFETKAAQIANSEERYNTYYLSIYKLVPDVKPHTWFVFVDFRLANSGCGPSLSMLYQKPDLLCAMLSTKTSEFTADRHHGDLLNVRNSGGWIRNGNIILFGLDEKGEVYILPEITPQSGVYINWFSREPIKTDYRRIVTDSSSELSPMVRHMLERRGILDAQ